MCKSLFLRIHLILAFIMVSTLHTHAAYGNSTLRLRGEVVDSISGAPIPFARILMSLSDRAELTDDYGRFDFTVSDRVGTIEVSAMGYAPKQISATSTSDIIVKLNPSGVMLDNVTVRPRKERYSKKNNPAVDFAKAIKNAGEKTDPRRHNYYDYNKYERITMSLNKISPDDKKNLILKRFDFLRSGIDTSEITGHPYLPLSVREKSSKVIYRRTPESTKEIVEGKKTVGLDRMSGTDNAESLYEDLLREIDLYQADIPLMQYRFVSPLSPIAPDFYRFYLTDTVALGPDTCIVLSFVPRTPESFGFTGKIYVDKGDTTMFVRKLTMNVSKSINLNFIEQLYINQEFDRAPDGSRLKTRDDLIVEMSVIDGTQGMSLRRNTAYTNHSFEEKHYMLPYFSQFGSVIEQPEADKVNELFWQYKRLIPLSEGERNTERMTRSLRSTPLFYWSEKIVRAFFSGYIHTGNPSKFDIGPINTTYSYNTLEGTRLRFGGMTTANLSRRLFAKGYGAYGFRDHKWKYMAEVEYSFNDKKYHAREFPIHSLRLTHLYDVDMIGQHYEFTNMDNMFLSLKRMEDRQITYHRVSTAEYNLELRNNLSFHAELSHQRQIASPYMNFTDGHGHSYSHYVQTKMKFRIRFAPGEKFMQTSGTRIPINLDAPVFSLTHTVSPKGFLGSRFTVNHTELSMQKRFWFSAFGYTDIILRGGHVWSRVAYPDLCIPNANLSYTIQPESFALLNPMEFVNDSYALWDMTYYANGAIFNYIPLLKRLKIREVVCFKGFFGTLSDRNNPSLNPSLFRFPTDASVSVLSPGRPYMEFSAGIDNVFKVLRVDYVWRLSYRDAPNISRGGVRIALHVTM